MAQTGIIDGATIALYVGGTKISNGTSGELDISMSTRETTNKDSSGWKTSLSALKSWTTSYEGLFAEDATYGYDDLFAAITAGTAVTAMISSGVTGDKKYTGSVIITNLKRSHPMYANATFSCTLEGTGALTEATI